MFKETANETQALQSQLQSANSFQEQVQRTTFSPRTTYSPSDTCRKR